MAVVMERTKQIDARLGNHSERIDANADDLMNIRISTAQMAGVFGFWKWAVPVVITIVGVTVAALNYFGRK